MKVHIEEGCIGCGFCVETCPEVFSMDDDGLAKVTHEPSGEYASLIKTAAGGCPVSVIKTEA